MNKRTKYSRAGAVVGFVYFLLLAVVPMTAAQGSKGNHGYTGRHWTVAPKVTRNGQPAPTTGVEYSFDKQVPFGQPGGCMTQKKINFGNILRCHIVLPQQVSGGIVQVQFSCTPDDPNGPCGHTVQCPGGAICAPLHLDPTTPTNLVLNKPRAIDWWGWTDDGNHAVLHFRVYAQ